MANSRAVFRKYAQFKGKEAKEFVEIRSGFYDQDNLITKGNSGQVEQTTINYKELTHWLTRNSNITFK